MSHRHMYIYIYWRFLLFSFVLNCPFVFVTKYYGIACCMSFVKCSACVLCRFQSVLWAGLSLCYVVGCLCYVWVLLDATCERQHVLWTSAIRSEHASLRSVGLERQAQPMIDSFDQNKRGPSMHTKTKERTYIVFVVTYIYIWIRADACVYICIHIYLYTHT